MGFELSLLSRLASLLAGLQMHATTSGMINTTGNYILLFVQTPALLTCFANEQPVIYFNVFLQSRNSNWPLVIVDFYIIAKQCFPPATWETKIFFTLQDIIVKFIDNQFK